MNKFVKTIGVAGALGMMAVAPVARGAVIISEIMYNPAGADGANPVSEWVEIVNTGSTSVDISGWRLDDEDNGNWAPFPQGTTLAAGQVAVVIDSAFATAATFRTEWSVPTAALVIAGGAGTLAPWLERNDVLACLQYAQRVVGHERVEPLLVESGG